jgi:hypothetical protein
VTEIAPVVVDSPAATHGQTHLVMWGVTVLAAHTQSRISLVTLNRHLCLVQSVVKSSPIDPMHRGLFARARSPSPLYDMIMDRELFTRNVISCYDSNRLSKHCNASASKRDRGMSFRSNCKSTHPPLIPPLLCAHRCLAAPISKRCCNQNAYTLSRFCSATP